MDATFDKLYYHKGELIGGIDESGVSDIAGPLISACVILPKIDLHKHDLRIFEINDSRAIPEKYRKQHAETIFQTAIAIGIGEATPLEVDYLGTELARVIASFRAINACKSLPDRQRVRPDFLMIDGTIPVKCGIDQISIHQGSAKSMCVAAASIVAKVYRDESMIQLHEQYPYYGWLTNKGFPCDEHFAGLDKHGLQIGIHRMQTWPLKAKRNLPPDQLEKWAKRRGLWRRVTHKRLQDLSNTQSGIAKLLETA